jgi:hypothetical protein
MKQIEFKLNTKLQKFLLIGVLLGVVSSVWGLVTDTQRMWINYLVNCVYFVSLALGGGLIISTTAVTNAAWGAPFKRLSEALMSFLPYGFAFMLVLFFGLHSLYEWTHIDVVAKDPILSGKSSYLNPAFFMIRIVIFFGIWILTTKMISYHSKKQDNDGLVIHTQKINFWSCIFLVTYALSYSFATFDWLMSLRPHWFSTIYALYNFSGMFVNVLAVLTFMIIWLQKRGYLKSVVTENNLHDLGKFILGFCTFWAYIWLSQYLLIWYSNIPEETLYFIGRELHTWDWLFYFNFFINWVIPFFALMTRDSKRSRFILPRICILLIIGRWLDIYLMVAPDVYETTGMIKPEIGLLEVGMGIGFGCLFVLLISRALSKSNLIAYNDPYLEEGTNLHQ